MCKARQEHFRQRPADTKTLRLDRVWNVLGGSVGMEYSEVRERAVR